MTTDFGNWKKSTRSNGGSGNCVEVGASAAAFGVRDTKDRQGGTLVFDRSQWESFIAGVKDGQFQR